MFLSDFAEFNISKQIPKIPLNVRSRKMAANMLREARNLHRGLRAPSVPKNKGHIMRPKIWAVNVVSPSVLSKMGVDLPSMNASDLPDLKNVKGKTASLRNMYKEAGNARGRSMMQTDLWGISHLKRADTVAKRRSEEYRRKNRLTNEMLSDGDYRRVIRAIYNEF